MPTTNPITDPKRLFLEIHPEEAKVFRAAVMSPAFKLAMSAALAKFLSRIPTAEQAAGAIAFQETFETIAEIDSTPIQVRGRPLSQTGRDPLPSSKPEPAQPTAPTQPNPTTRTQ